MKNKDIGTEEVLYRLGLVAALVAAIGFWLLRLGPAALRDWLDQWSFCVVYRFTGFTCPGCGGTRAFAELLHGNILASLLYHPLVLYGLGLYAAFMGSHTFAKLGNRLPDSWLPARLREKNGRPVFRGMKWKNIYAKAAVWLLLGNFVIKNLIHLLTGQDVLARLEQMFS